MAVLTEAIEAERGAEAGIADGLVATVTTTALEETSTVVVGVLVLVLAPHTMTVTIDHLAAPVGMIERMIDALAVTVNAAQAAVALSLPNLLKMNVIGALFSYSSLLRDFEPKS